MEPDIFGYSWQHFVTLFLTVYVTLFPVWAGARCAAVRCCSAWRPSGSTWRAPTPSHSSSTGLATKDSQVRAKGSFFPECEIFLVSRPCPTMSKALIKTRCQCCQLFGELFGNHSRRKIRLLRNKTRSPSNFHFLNEFGLFCLYQWKNNNIFYTSLE
jgi:hypothetical protein